jgi:septal ring factor EnvC (AmiA/AmiB activator)
MPVPAPLHGTRSSVARSRLRRALEALAVCTLAAAVASSAHADSLDDRRHAVQDRLAAAKTRLQKARQREGSLAAQIAAQSRRIDAVEADAGHVASELADLEAQLAQSRRRLTALERQLAQKSRQLAMARRQLAIAQHRLNRRVAELYTSDEPALIEILLGSEDLETMIDQVETRSSIVEYDSLLVSRVTALRATVARQRARTAVLRRRQSDETARLADRTSARRAAYSSLVAQRSALASLRSDRQRSLVSIQVQRREWEAQADALEAESARIAAVIAAAAREASPTDATASPPVPAATASGFIWPVAGSVVSPFGERWGRLHAGVDIAAPAGTPIVASAAGRVLYASSMNGYGLIVVIEHAGGIATAYAHNSSISVSQGENVTQGQTIAAVGCTGRCFGDHVHFEVRVGGSPVDPMSYL